MAHRTVAIVRVYEDPGRKAGDYRALVDRLWPRGLSKNDVDFDEWAQDVAPSTELRRWYGHEPSRFVEFSRRYRRELAQSPGVEGADRLRQTSGSGRLVLLTATRDVEHSGAAVLRRVVGGEAESS
jgi:uncharacterized protein YeaO (DUF488 family)